jgi:MerR family transcriptional regulator, copper efflux regulator
MDTSSLSIGAAARASGVSIKMIRHYESVGLLPKVARSFGNYRLYSPNDIHVLRFIRRARTLGFSMPDIRQLVSLWRNTNRSSAAVKKIAGKHVDELRRKLAELDAMLKTLEHLMRHCHGDQRPECPILEDLAH